MWRVGREVSVVCRMMTRLLTKHNFLPHPANTAREIKTEITVRARSDISVSISPAAVLAAQLPAELYIYLFPYWGIPG